MCTRVTNTLAYCTTVLNTPMKTFVDEAKWVVAPYDAPLLHTIDLAKRETNILRF